MPAGYLRCSQFGLDRCVCMYLCLSADSSHYCELHCPHHHLHSVCYRGSVFVCTILVKLHGSELITLSHYTYNSVSTLFEEVSEDQL